MSKIPLAAVVGPTASGKTALGVELALRLGGEIVSADSMQIYKGIPIASAVATEEEKRGVPHHLTEFLKLSESFSVADYVVLAKKKINDINSRLKLPILVGGTGLYFNSLVDGIEFSKQEENSFIRKKYEKICEELGSEEMLKRLYDIDPEYAEKLHSNNKRRIIRAFEIYEQTGRNVTQQNILSRQNQSEYRAVTVGITYKDREKLYERINKRVDIMLENGLLKEAESTFENGASKTAYQAIGHKELYPYFSGEKSLEEAVEDLKRQTRRYAKRQLTWFNKREDINWIFADECDDLPSAAEKIIKEGLQNG